MAVSAALITPFSSTTTYHIITRHFPAEAAESSAAAAGLESFGLPEMG